MAKATKSYLGSSTAAGATAAVMANMVLIGYIIVAIKEDGNDKAAADGKAKKSQ